MSNRAQQFLHFAEVLRASLDDMEAALCQMETKTPDHPVFIEMAGLSLCVAGLSFLVGYVIRIFLGVDI